MTDANRPIIDPSTGEIIDGWVAHPAADLFPMAQADELDGLTADIAEHGLVESIWTVDDGVVLDGRNRLVACHRLGLTPTVKRYGGDDPITFAVSLNLHRRHLEKSQVAAIARESIPLYAEEARKKQAEAGRKYGENHPKELEADLPQALEEKRAPQARDRAAEAFGISGRLVGQVDRIAEQAPDLLPEIKAGTLTANAAEKILKDRLKVEQAESDLTDEEIQLLNRLDGGETIILNFKHHRNLATKLEAETRLVKIDRTGPWGNPFILDSDGDRDTVIRNYRDQYLPHKPSLLNDLNSLKGRALGCWCSPLPCHGDVLKGLIDS